MRQRLLVFLLVPLLLLAACQKQTADAPLRNSVYYQVFVGSFYDSDQDGVGDLQGVIEKLDYLQNDLGVSGIWLSPIHPRHIISTMSSITLILILNLEHLKILKNYQKQWMSVVWI